MPGLPRLEAGIFPPNSEVDLDAKKTTKRPSARSSRHLFNGKTNRIGAQRPRFALWEAKIKSEDACYDAPINIKYTSFPLVKYSLEVGKLLILNQPSKSVQVITV